MGGARSWNSGLGKCELNEYIPYILLTDLKWPVKSGEILYS
jgi:hypothetical protein